MDRIKFRNHDYIRDSFASRPRYGEFGSLPIDKTPSKSFNIDPDTGRPMSDVDKLIKTSDAQEMLARFSSLDEVKSNFLPKDMDDISALSFLHPRSAQLPSELAHWQEGLAQRQYQKAQAAKRAELQKAADERVAAYMKEMASTTPKED